VRAVLATSGDHSDGKMLEARQDEEKPRSTAPPRLKEATLSKGNDLHKGFFAPYQAVEDKE